MLLWCTEHCCLWRNLCGRRRNTRLLLLLWLLLWLLLQMWQRCTHIHAIHVATTSAAHHMRR